MSEHPARGPVGALRADRGIRTLRALAFSAVCLSASGCAHALASGSWLSWRPLLAGWLAIVCLVAPLTGRERSRPGIIAALLCGQILLHVIFSLGQCHGTAAVPHPAHAGPGHEAGAAMGASLMPGPMMFALHLAAAGLLGRLVHHGDRALWGLMRLSRRAAGTLGGGPLALLLGALLLRLPAVPFPRVPTGARTRDAEDAPYGIVLLHHAVIRRGPPAPA